MLTFLRIRGAFHKFIDTTFGDTESLQGYAYLSKICLHITIKNVTDTCIFQSTPLYIKPLWDIFFLDSTKELYKHSLLVRTLCLLEA